MKDIFYPIFYIIVIIVARLILYCLIWKHHKFSELSGGIGCNTLLYANNSIINHPFVVMVVDQRPYKRYTRLIGFYLFKLKKINSAKYLSEISFSDWLIVRDSVSSKLNIGWSVLIDQYYRPCHCKSVIVSHHACTRYIFPRKIRMFLFDMAA